MKQDRFMCKNIVIFIVTHLNYEQLILVHEKVSIFKIDFEGANGCRWLQRVAG